MITGRCSGRFSGNRFSSLHITWGSFQLEFSDTEVGLKGAFTGTFQISFPISHSALFTPLRAAFKLYRHSG